MIEVMSDLYSDLEKEFVLVHADEVETAAALKEEVRLVRGSRRNGTRKSNQDDSDEIKGKEEGNRLSSNIGGGDMPTKVMQMKCSIINGSLAQERSKNFDQDLEYQELKAESIRLFKGYCIQAGIPLLPEEVKHEHSSFGQQRADTRNKKGKAGEPSKSGVRKASNASGKSHSTQSRKSGAGSSAGGRGSKDGGGGGGGGKPPPNHRESSSSDQDDTWPDTETDVTSRPSTAASAAHSQVAFKVQSHVVRTNQRKTLGPNSKRSFLAKAVRSEPSLLNLKPSDTDLKRVKSDTSMIAIRTYKASGKMNKPIKMEKRITIANLFPEKMTPLPAPPPIPRHHGESRKRVRVEKKRHSDELTIRSSEISLLSEVSSESNHPSTTPPLVAPRKSRSQPKKSILRRRRSTRQSAPMIQRPSTIKTLDDVRRRMETERSGEWLEWTASEEESEEKDHHEGDKENENEQEKLPIPIQPEFKTFLDSTRVLDKINTIFGLSPFTIVVRKDGTVRYKWMRKSFRYIYMAVNSLFYVMITLYIFVSFLAIIRYDEPLPSTKEIIKIDFGNHFIEVLFVTLISLFLTLWSVSYVFAVGAHYADYMNRFNLAIFLTKYDVSDGIYSMIWKLLLTLFIFEAAVVTLFFGGRSSTSIMRESCGFLGYALLRQFDYRVRESEYEPLVEILGLFVFLYVFFCFNVVLLQFAVYAKAVGNLGRRFHLRLAFALGAVLSSSRKKVLDSGSEEFKKQISDKNIPYEKLLAEQKIVTSLMRNLTHVNFIFSGAFLFCMVCEIALIMWLFFDMFIDRHAKGLEDLKVYYVGDSELAVPIRLKKKEGERLMKALVIFLVTWLTYWVFGNVLHAAGAEVNEGSEHVRRHGLIRCRSSKERRFILSLMTSYCPKNPYWFGKSFKFNRAFLTSLMAFVIAASVVTVSFRPARLELASHEVCTQFGVCNFITIYKTAEHIFYNALDLDATPSPSPGSGSRPQDPALVVTDAFKLNSNLRILRPPCGSIGTYPMMKEELITCPANWPFLSEIKMPFHYKLVTISDSANVSFDFSEPIQHPFKSESATGTGSNTTGTGPCRTVPMPEFNFGRPPDVLQTTDCFGNNMENRIPDDCGNLPFSTLDRKLQQKKEVTRALFVNDIVPDVSINSIVCCFEYVGIENSKNQVKVCNLPNSPTFLAFCKIGTDRERIKENPHVFQYHRRISTRLHHEKKSKGNTNYLQVHQETIAKCVCKLEEPQIGLESEEHCQCTGLYLLPCKLFGYLKDINQEDYSLACGPVRVPLLFKTNSDLSLVFHGEHQRYKESCTEPEFRDRFNHSDSLNNYSIPCSSLNSSVNLKLVDCAGNPIEPQEASDIDDCSNWRINTPDTSSEMMLEVLLTLKAYNINRGSKEIVESKSMHKAFLCCFQYEGPVFRTDAQNKYCNAPTIDAMSTGSWCGGVVNNYGKRIPSVEYREKKFKKFFMDLELTVRYHEKNGKDNWLNSPEINRKLVKCMCPDKLLDFNKTKWELAIVEECNPLIATMEELIDADLIPVPFRLCDHKWPPTSLPHKLGTPAVYVFEYDDYEMPDSFRKLGDPQTTSPCLLDSSYEHVFKNDGNPPLFDNAQSPLPPGKTDDCMSLPIPTPETVGFSNSTPLVAPKLRLVVEPFLELFKPGAFRDSKSVHCCYHYSGFEGNQHEVCNMPEPDAIKRQCYLKGRSLERKKHEFELVRRAVVHQYGGVFLGDRVPPLDLRLDEPEETKWKGCICNDSPSHSSNDQCKQIYLPPCVIPRNKKYSYLVKREQIRQMHTLCSATWSTGSFKMKFPILFEFNPMEQMFSKRNLYWGSECPTSDNNPNLNPPSMSGNTFTDCYGHDLGSNFQLDDCGNPRVASPRSYDSNHPGYRDSTEYQLLAIDKTGVPGLKFDFLCCWNYGVGAGIGSQLGLCNMPSKEAMDRRCKLRAESSPQIRGYVEELREKRSRGEDPIAYDVSFSNPTRISWTSCLCRFNEQECIEVA